MLPAVWLWPLGNDQEEERCAVSTSAPSTLTYRRSLKRSVRKGRGRAIRSFSSPLRLMAVYSEKSKYSPRRLFQHQYTAMMSRITKVSSPRKVSASMILSITPPPISASFWTASMTA